MITPSEHSTPNTFCVASGIKLFFCGGGEERAEKSIRSESSK